VKGRTQLNIIYPTTSNTYISHSVHAILQKRGVG